MVVVEGKWGRIEELTLSYVVVQIWDDRRLILPTSYFTSTPFQNWTLTQAAVLDTAEFDVDWSIPVQAMREELRRLVESTDLWDSRVCVLQVTDATGGLIKVWALVSAANAGSLWGLRCLVREHLVAWVRDHRPIAMPRLRAELGDGESSLPWQWAQPRQSVGRPSDGEAPDDARIFGGSDDGDARSDTFVGPAESAEARRWEVSRSRRHHAAGVPGPAAPPPGSRTSSTPYRTESSVPSPPPRQPRPPAVSEN